ncbi:glutathione synthase [Acidihalobacter ferrooxydans]|uniref:Glutathione synthetase n=1 Tax=Acidihalobacter ferrooxydans TaxID=1765967 RepID=A0A1P8UK55_9GAMM|nr:glutathione synthase [Acidihalobacter ferrooxydans]APZ44218.1 glutathione synthase [Acidihalobacter ferrooxydans]
MNARRLAVLMDPISRINIKKDSTFAMLLAAQRRGWPLHYLEQADLYLRDGQAWARLRPLRVADDPTGWFELGAAQEMPLSQMDAVLMRKDPPFDLEFMYTTLLLELAERDDTLVINRPASLRDANEKLFTAWFPQCTVPTLVSRDMQRLHAFATELGDVILKPLNGMGGESIFRVRADDPNTNVILETMTARGTRTVMAQRFIPEYVDGDRRILLINGEPVPYALLRIPAAGESRANLAAGGHGVGIELSERDRWICAQVGPELVRRGLMFVGLDVIGGQLTEINVTSPTCIRELDAQYGIDIASQLMDAIDARLA